MPGMPSKFALVMMAPAVVVLATLVALALRALFRAAREVPEMWTRLRLRARCPHPEWRCDLYRRKWRGGIWLYCWECDRWVARPSEVSSRRGADLW